MTIIPYASLGLGIVFAVPVCLMLFGIYVAGLPVLIVCHLISAGLATTGFYLLSARERSEVKKGNIWYLFAAVMCFTMPFYGIVATAAVYLLRRSLGARPPPIVSDEIFVQSARVFSRPISRLKQIEILDRMDIEPFVDIFRRGRSELKKSAIKFLGSIRSKSAIRTLNRALMDDDIEVRLYAAGVIGMIDDGFTKRIEEKKRTYQKNEADRDAALDLARTYFAYAQSGILDKIAADYYYQTIIKLVDDGGRDPASSYLVAKCYFELGRYEEAKRYIEVCTRAVPDDHDYNEMRCRVLFARSDYAEVVEGIGRTGNSEIISFWQ